MGVQVYQSCGKVTKVGSGDIGDEVFVVGDSDDEKESEARE